MKLFTLMITSLLLGATSVHARAMTCEGKVVTIGNAEQIYQEMERQIYAFNTINGIVYALDSGLFDKMNRDTTFLERGLLVLRSFMQNGETEKNFYAVSEDYAKTMLAMQTPEICKIPQYSCTSETTGNGIDVAGFNGCASCAATSNTPPNGTCATSCTQCCVHFGNADGTRCGCPDPETCP